MRIRHYFDIHMCWTRKLQTAAHGKIDILHIESSIHTRNLQFVADEKASFHNMHTTFNID